MATVVLPKPEPSPDETLSDIKGFVEDVNDTLKSDKRAKRKADKEQLDVTERMSENMEWFGSMYEQTNTGKKAKLRDKLSEGWTKVFKNKWFEGIFGFMRRMSLGGIGDFLGLLLGIFVLIQTGLLDVLIPILINMAQVLITAIIKYLPRFIKFLIHILKDVLPPFFETIFNTILDAVGVDKNSPLRKLVKPLSKILPWLLAFGLLIGKFLPMIMTAVRFLQPVISGLLKFLPHIGKLLAGLNPVGIVAIIITAVWIFAEEIVKVYDWIIEKVFDLVFSFFPSLKPFKDVIVSMVKAFFMLTPNIYSLARLFANIKKLGFLEGFKKTIKEFLGSFFDIVGGIYKFFGIFTDDEVDKGVEDAKNIIFGMFDSFTSFLKENVLPIWTEVKKAFSSAFDMFVDTFREVWGEIKTIGMELFDEIYPIFSEIFGIFSSGTENYISGVKIFMEFFKKILKTSLTFLKPFLKFFSKIFIKSFKVFAVMIKALIPPFRFFIFIVEKLVKGFSKLKNMFSSKGLKETLTNLGGTLISVINSAFLKSKDAFEIAFTSILDVFLMMFDNLSFQLSKILPGVTNKSKEFQVKSAEGYSEEQRYIRAYAKKYNLGEERLKEIATGKVSPASLTNVNEKTFANAINQMKTKGEKEQIAYLQQLVKAVKEGNNKKETNVNVSTGGTLTDPSIKR